MTPTTLEYWFHDTSSPRRRRRLMCELYTEQEEAANPNDLLGYRLARLEILWSHVFDIFTAFKDREFQRFDQWDLVAWMELVMARLNDLMPDDTVSQGEPFHSLWIAQRNLFNYLLDWEGTGADALSIATLMFVAAGVLKKFREVAHPAESSGVEHGFFLASQALPIPLPAGMDLQQSARVLLQNFQLSTPGQSGRV